MRICILTTIKDERPYLDEWISYHLGMGFSHIYMIEDLGSEPHDDIVARYGDKATLWKADALIGEGIASVRRDKLTKRANPQAAYFKRGLERLRDEGAYD